MKNVWKILATVPVVLVLGLILVGLSVPTKIDLPDGAAGRHVELDGMRIRVRQAGRGPDVLFLHGGMGSVEDFDPLFERLGARYRMTAFDRPGMGYSELAGEAYSLNGAARVTRDLIRTLGLAKVILVGHSYGGGVVLATLIQGDPAVRGALLLAPAAYNLDDLYRKNDSPIMRLLRVPAFGRGLAALAGPFLGEKMIAAVLDPMTAGQSGFPEDFLPFRQRLWNNAVSTTTRALQGAAFDRDMPAISARYGEIRVPVTVLVGDRDIAELQSFAPRLARDIPRAKTVILPGVNHYVQFEEPDAVIREIDALAVK